MLAENKSCPSCKNPVNPVYDLTGLFEKANNYVERRSSNSE